MKYILSLDAGTTSNRAILFDENRQVVGKSQREFPQYYPKPGWVEQDPKELLSTMLGVATEAISLANIPRRDIVALGITNQRETTILWDRKTGLPVHNAIVWQCRRTADMAQNLIDAGHQEMIFQKTGLIIDAYFSATKIKYILDHVEGLRDRAKRGEIAFGTVDSYLLYHLTGGKSHKTDPSNASRTMLYNIKEERWDEEILTLLDIPREILPEVIPSDGDFGMTDPDIFGISIPIHGILGDQQAALFGQGCFAEGDIKNTYGTGSFILMNIGSEVSLSDHGLLTSIAWKVGEETAYALEGSIFICGSAVDFLRDNLGIIEGAHATSTMAYSVPDTHGVQFVPAFTGLGTPYWDASTRGTLLGLSRGVRKEHIVRATLEAIALMSYDVIKAMEKDSGLRRSVLKVDGGVSANDFLMEMQANILQADVIRPKEVERTALGAALMAGMGVGLYRDLEELKNTEEEETLFQAKMDQREKLKMVEKWHVAIDTARAYGRDMRELER